MQLANSRKPPVSAEYNIEIPNEKMATYRVINFIISIINLLAFAYLLFNSGFSSAKNIILIGFIISLLAPFIFLLKKYSRFLSHFKIEILFIICAIIWFISSNYLLGLLLMVFALLGIAVQVKPVIHFNEYGIRYPGFPAKLFLWNEVDSVQLKEGILTIEMKHNRLMQYSLQNEIANAVNAAAFNDFCAAQVLKK